MCTGDETARRVSKSAKPAQREPPLELITNSIGSPGEAASSHSRRLISALAESSVTSPSRKTRRCERWAASSSQSDCGGAGLPEESDDAESAEAAARFAAEVVQIAPPASKRVAAKRMD